MRLGRFIRSLQVHVPPSLTATCQPLPLSMKVRRTIYNGSFFADHGHEAYWSNRVQTVGQIECKWLVSGNAIRWSSEMQLRNGRPRI
jgi:hypothetical protein